MVHRQIDITVAASILNRSALLLAPAESPVSNVDAKPYDEDLWRMFIMGLGRGVPVRNEAYSHAMRSAMRCPHRKSPR